jgi:DNA-binding LytR/AlgR family response regulator
LEVDDIIVAAHSTEPSGSEHRLSFNLIYLLLHEEVVMKIMIVEDEPLVTLELERIATEAGHEVVGSFMTAEQALAYASKAQVAFVDLGLADGHSGAGLARRLTDRFRIKVIFVTGSPERVGYGLEGAVGVIDKPFTDKMIIDALEKAQRLQG